MKSLKVYLLSCLLLPSMALAQSVNLNSTLPAAPSNAVNVTFNNDTASPAHVSAYLTYAQILAAMGTELGTTPTAGQLPIGTSGGGTYAPLSMSGDCTLTSTGAVTCTKSSGTAFGTAAFQPSSAFDAAGLAAAEQSRATTAEATKLPAGSCTNVSGTLTCPTVAAGSTVFVGGTQSLASFISLCANNTLQISATITQGAVAAIPTPCAIRVVKGGSIACDVGGDAIDFQGAPIIAPATQIFTGCASGQVRNIGGAIIPDWFGAINSFTTTQLAIAACPSSGPCEYQGQCNEVYAGTSASTIPQGGPTTPFHFHGCPQKPSLNVSIGGIASGTYTSGITATGSSTQTCNLAFANGATATVPLTGTNTIAGSTALTIILSGQGAFATPTTATVSNGTATCTGTPALVTVLATPSSLVGGTIFTPSLGFSGSNIEIDHIGIDDGPTRQPANPQNGLVVSCTTALAAACGNSGSVHDVITLGNSATAAFHGQLIGEGYDNFKGHDLESYWGLDGVVSKCTNCTFYNIISKGHSLSDFYMKSDNYAPLNNVAFWGLSLGVITPGDTQYGITLQALDAPATSIAGSAVQISGTTNGIYFQGGSSTNALSNVSLAGLSFVGLSGQGLLATGFVSHVDIPGFSITGSAGWSSIPVASNPNVTDFHIGHIASDTGSGAGCFDGASVKIDDTYSISSGNCTGSILSAPIYKFQMISPNGPGCAISTTQNSTCTGTNGTYTALAGMRIVAADFYLSIANGCTTGSGPAIGIFDSTTSARMNTFFQPYAGTSTTNSINTSYRIAVVGNNNLIVNKNDILTVYQGVNASSCSPGPAGTINEVDVYYQPY